MPKLKPRKYCQGKTSQIRKKKHKKHKSEENVFKNKSNVIKLGLIFSQVKNTSFEDFVFEP